MEIDGKKIALGVPGARPADAGPKAYALIPLQRGATPDEAAASMLLYVLPVPSQTPYNSDERSHNPSLSSPLASFVTGHTLEVTGGAGI